ncbi:hypothetical protein D3C86_1858940 [compost metagenome]
MVIVVPLQMSVSSNVNPICALERKPENIASKSNMVYFFIVIQFIGVKKLILLHYNIKTAKALLLVGKNIKKIGKTLHFEFEQVINIVFK